MIDAKKRKEIVKKEYHKKIKTIEYWNKVDKMFKKMHKKKVARFNHTFEHFINMFLDFPLDDEIRIGTYAKKYGYVIVDENLSSTKSTYTFELIE